MSEQAYLDLRLFSGFELAVAHKDGANWQKEQMMKEAVDCMVCRDGKISLLQYNRPVFANVLEKYKDNDKVKMIIIKEG